MNEAGGEESLALLSEDTVKLDVYINSVIPDAANLLYASAPHHLIPAKNASGSINSSGIVSIPSDFLRFHSLKLSSWKRGTAQVHAMDSEEYKRMHYATTTAGENKPRCVFEGASQIKCFPPSGALDYFYYVAKCNDVDEALGMPSSLAPSLPYMCAALVYDIFEMGAQSDRMKSLAIELVSKS